MSHAYQISEKQRLLMKAGMYRPAWVQTPSEYNRVWRLANRGLVKRTFIHKGKVQYVTTPLGKTIYKRRFGK